MGGSLISAPESSMRSLERGGTLSRGGQAAVAAIRIALSQLMKVGVLGRPILLVRDSFRRLFPAGSFGRNVLTLVTGTTIAQIISIAIAPILTRLYSPSDYGMWAIYTSIASMLTVVATGRYEMTIMLPTEDKEAFNLVSLTAGLTLCVSVIVLIVLCFFARRMASLLQASEMWPWLYALPVSIFLAGQYQALNYWANRKNQYRRLALYRVLQALVTSGLSLAFGFARLGVGGLLLAALAGQALGAFLLGTFVWFQEGANRKAVTYANMRRLLVRYRDFPTFSLPSDLVNVGSLQLPVLLLTRFFGAGIAGLFSLTQRILALPVSFMGNSILDVFKQRASSDYSRMGQCREIYLRTIKHLAVISSVPSLALLVAGPLLFKTVFGETWTVAGEYAQILAPMYFFKFLSSPLSYLYYIAEKQREDFLLHLYIALSTVGTFWGGFVLSHSAKVALVLFSANFSLIYIFYLVRSYTFAQGQRA